MSSVKSALVTGATSGIGRALAERLLRDGWRVVGVGRDFRHWSSTPERFVRVELDLADLDRLPDRLTTLARSHPAIDALVLCAGRGRFGSLEELSYAEIRGLMDLNFTSQAFLTRAFVPLLKRRGRGDVILIGSESAVRGGRKGSVYCASKFALRGFAQALRDECARSGVRVTLINPGMVATPFFDDLNFAPGLHESQHLVPDDVVAAAAMVLHARPDCVFDEISLSPRNHVVRSKAD
jgi:3-hydroxy acid dehydrogenase / malonic semialdehyde reductase